MSGGDHDGPADVTRADVSEGETLIERRRPGRKNYTNSALIRMLRHLAGLASEEDQGIPARGIIIGLGISAALWSVIGLIIWLVVRR
jgi:hypothetical protein